MGLGPGYETETERSWVSATLLTDLGSNPDHVWEELQAQIIILAAPSVIESGILVRGIEKKIFKSSDPVNLTWMVFLSLVKLQCTLVVALL